MCGTPEGRPEVVRVNARGKILKVSRDALLRNPETLLARLSDQANLMNSINGEGEVMLDRDAALTKMVIKVMETGTLRWCCSEYFGSFSTVVPHGPYIPDTVFSN